MNVANAFAGLLARIGLVLAAMCALGVSPAMAASCGTATSAGAAPPGWETYCWLDMSTYNDASARSAGGQALSFPLADGSIFNMTIKTVSTAATGANAVAAPSWTGGAIGNSSFLGIPGKPILYGANNASTVTFTLSSLSITPPAGATAGTFMFIVADGESSNQTESLTYTTNGGNWTLLDQVPPISGTTYPNYALSGQTATVTGVAGTVGAQIFGSVTPTTVTAQIVNGGLQGVMFAVRFASIRLNKTILSSRLAAPDQFTYNIRSTTSGNTLISGTSSGTTNGPFTAAILPLASGISVTVDEAMAAGSTSTLGLYSARLTCTNSSVGSPTPLPNNVAATNYVIGSIAYGDNIACMFTNAPVPRVALAKALGGTRVFASDQFTVQIKAGATVTASATTTGTGATVAGGTTGATQVTAGTTYGLSEIAAGTTVLTYYTSTLACTNTYAASTTALPSAMDGTVSPAAGDNISCTLTNTPKAAKAELTMTKTSSIVSDPVNGTTDPKLIPGAIVQYVLTVANQGLGPVDLSTVVLNDPVPTTLGTYVQGTAVTFADGTPSSGLTCTYASCVAWTKTAGGTSGYGAALSPDGSGYDDAITGIRISPAGIMPAATLSGQPSFTVTFRTRIK